MVKVAVAGGTGGIGRHIVDAILATQKHDVVVLSRSAHAELSSRGAAVRTVSYTDPASLEAALQGVHTVISTIADAGNPGAWVTSQIALLDAAKRAGAARFAPSAFGWHDTGDTDAPDLYAYKRRVAAAAQASGLEYTTFENGMFMDYLASGTAGVGYLRPLKFVVDVENCSAKVPGDGTKPFVFTAAQDVGAFVAASLDLPTWPEFSRMVGEEKSWQEVIALAEHVRGRKFDVTYVSVAELEKQLVPDPPSPLTNFVVQLLIGSAKGMSLGGEPNLNALFPEIRPTTVEAFLKAWWGKAEA